MVALSKSFDLSLSAVNKSYDNRRSSHRMYEEKSLRLSTAKDYRDSGSKMRRSYYDDYDDDVYHARTNYNDEEDDQGNSMVMTPSEPIYNPHKFDKQSVTASKKPGRFGEDQFRSYGK